jgi:hypothetical protein
LAVNDNMDILLAEANRGTLSRHFASKVETEQALIDMEERISAMMRIKVSQQGRCFEFEDGDNSGMMMGGVGVGKHGNKQD